MTHDEICDRLQKMLDELRSCPLRWPEAYAVFRVTCRSRSGANDPFTLVLGIEEPGEDT